MGNSVTIVVIGRTRRLYNHCTPFLLNLAIGLVMMMAIMIMMIVLLYFIDDFAYEDDESCKLQCRKPYLLCYFYASGCLQGF